MFIVTRMQSVDDVEPDDAEGQEAEVTLDTYTLEMGTGLFEGDEATCM